jgi:glycosyltransferase involved in cell wall biosynthesis
MQRLRILIVAHEFSPIKGSESAVGWNIVTRLCKYHDITVLYASGSQFKDTSYVDVINNYFFEAATIPGLNLVNIDKPGVQKIIAKVNYLFRKLSPIGLPILYYLGYKHWQKKAYNEARHLHEIYKFNIVHQLTQITFREPGYMWKLGVPFVWGPTGGTSTFPKKFRSEFSMQSKILESIRTFSNFFQFDYIPRILKANQKANIIYTFSNADAERFKKRAKGEVKIMLDVGTYSRPKKVYTAQKKETILQGIWCGRLSDYKAPSILLKALAKSQLTRDKVKFTIIGNGSLEKSLIELATTLKLYNIEWIKQVEHEKVFDLMSHSDFFVHTSLREATSSVITEALSMGLPVICHDAYGMNIAINETCGIKVPLLSPEHSIQGFHLAIEKLISDNEFLENLKMGAKSRAIEISWENMAETMASDYVALFPDNLH